MKKKQGSVDKKNPLTLNAHPHDFANSSTSANLDQLRHAEYVKGIHKRDGINRRTLN